MKKNLELLSKKKILWFYSSFKYVKKYDYPVDKGRKLNVHKTFNLRPVSMS